MDDAERMEQGKLRRTGAEPLVPKISSTTSPPRMISKLSACAEISGNPRLEALHKLQSKNR